MKLLQTIAASVLVLGMGSAFAEEPVILTDSQMDKVNAGVAVAVSSATSFAVLGSAEASSTAIAIGSDFIDIAVANTNTKVNALIGFANADAAAIAD